SAARTKFWGERKKITDLSTPGEKEGNYIDDAYEKGDKRLYMVPCPMCHKFQPLYEIPEEGSFGLRADRKNGKIIKVYYLCDFCHDAIFDNSKFEIFNSGKWEPTAISDSPFYRSYYINSLYSPPRTVSWKDYYIEWENSKISPDDERVFINLYAGLSYEETGSRPKIESIHHLRGTYSMGTIPDGVLFLTAAVDVQRGSDRYRDMSPADLAIEIKQAKKEGKDKNFPRLEMEILGHGGGYRTWSIGYYRFEGHLLDIEAGAWEKLTDHFRNLAIQSDVVKNGLKVPAVKREDGYNFEIPFVLIDARDGTMTETVYSYTQKFDIMHPSMGVNTLSSIS
ncbi:MAG: phage terminase large subunit family protein, partial [Candidatus Heimdallarchaeota archaeon]|nr:phage terminase large subunit family protein [Candidatus Heimdallarchaeota archaeon]